MLQKIFAKKQGIASLPAILLFGGVLLEIGIASAFLVFYLNNSVYGARLSNEALLAAQSGIDDGILQVILNKDCPSGECPSSYSLSVGSREADVTICKDSCSGSGSTQIKAVGKAFTKRRSLTAVVTIDEGTGSVSLTSLQESNL
ncbi:MAG: hypothetical protein Q8P45_03020 [Candidatus Harrisonbacteria bacterium]|nr:hypothetical protein [Candidatus Harrisonbacteria bacterium]